RRRPGDDRPRPGLAGRLCVAGRSPPRGNPHRDRPAGLELHHSSHRPAGHRTAAKAARTAGCRTRGGGHQSLARADLGGSGMLAGFPLPSAEPLFLLGLLSLPILWWLLRLVPPRPRRINFPPTRILFDIIPREETPARTPWWLTLLRLTLAALAIIAAARPLWNPPVATTTASAPLLLLIHH